MATLHKQTHINTGETKFAELHCVSHYSFLRGASHPEELVNQAAAQGYEAIAITDECSFSGLVKGHLAVKDYNQNKADDAQPIKLIVGAEFKLVEGFTLVLIAPNRNAYGEIAALITKLRRRSPKGEYYMNLEDLNWGLGDCFAIWIPATDVEIQTLVEQGRLLKQKLKHLWIGLELFLEDCDLDKTAYALTLSIRLELPIVACNDVHTHVPQRQPLQDVITAIRLQTTVDELGTQSHPNAEHHLRSIESLLTLYPKEMLEESSHIAEQCLFSMDELRYEYPEELVPPHLEPNEYLRQLTFAGGALRWPNGIPEDVLTLVNKELKLIEELNYEYYFLTVQDIVHFARSKNILCQGRGSAANSAVCFCLHITEVDPSRMHLLFERFVSKERNEPPDIDVDFEHERREEVIQYIYSRYGRDRAALAATLVTYRPKSAIRDVGKALGMDLDLLDLLAKSLSWWDKKEALVERFTTAGLDPKGQLVEQFLYFINEILGFPRHLSQHVGGFVISRGPLAQLVPVENASMEDRTVIQWDKTDLEALGLLKVDILALGMLTAIRKALDLINNHRGTDLTVSGIPAEDGQAYKLLQRGDSIGVFQVESRAQMSMLPRLKPQHFYDLVIEVAIVRPGPIQGDMVHPYLRRRQGLEAVTYSNDAVRNVLERTLGVPIFQEQVIELAMVAAGFSAGEADQLRRAMAAWQRKGGLEHFEQKLIDGMLARGHDQEFAERVFKQIKGFGEYGFPESHAASFALLVYISAWLKCHEPTAFYCGLLNSLPMGFYSASQLIQDAKRHGIDVRPVCVQHSAWDHRFEDNASDTPAMRLGLRLVKGLSNQAGERIEAHRPFINARHLADRAQLDNQELQFLARAGALAKLSGHRHQAHWDVAGLTEALPLQKTQQQVADNHSNYDTKVSLPEPRPAENMINDYRYLKLTLGPHPLALLRTHQKMHGVSTALQLETHRNGKFVRVAGIVAGRQRPSTATGVLFVTLEDETGNVNLVVWSSVLERFRAALLQGKLLIVKGNVQKENEVIHVVAGHIEDASGLLIGLIDDQSIDSQSIDSQVGAENSPVFGSRDFR